MVNPSDISQDKGPFVYTCHCSSISGVMSVGLDPNRVYTFGHNSENEAFVSDTNTIFLATSGNPITQTNPVGVVAQYRLKNGGSIDVGPGLSSVSFRSTAGCPTFTIAPGSRVYDV